MALEIEAKFLVDDFAPVQDALLAADYRCVQPRRLMQRRTFRLTEKAGATPREWARVRNEGDKVTMTYKHHFADHATGTEEVEVTVDSYDNAVRLMEKLGFTEQLVQENYRETWARDGVQITLDEWPVIGRLVEIEGPDEATVQAHSAGLGFDYNQAVFGGVGTLYFKRYGKDMGLVPLLTFGNVAEVTAFLNQ